MLNIDIHTYNSRDRNRFILSKGHACLALYVILRDLDILSDDRLVRYSRDGGLGGQLDISIPGVDWNTGSLGHSLGVCCGMALASKLSEQDYFVYTIVGDAEFYEGSIWEGINFAAEHSLNNLVCIIDRNRLSVTEVLGDDTFYSTLPAILENLGWDAHEINGHDHKEILSTLHGAKKSTKPTMIIANTIKGKGVSFMENKSEWHCSTITEKQIKEAQAELNV